MHSRSKWDKSSHQDANYVLQDDLSDKKSFFSHILSLASFASCLWFWQNGACGFKLNWVLCFTDVNRISLHAELKNNLKLMYEVLFETHRHSEIHIFKKSIIGLAFMVGKTIISPLILLSSKIQALHEDLSVHKKQNRAVHALLRACSAALWIAGQK